MFYLSDLFSDFTDKIYNYFYQEDSPPIEIYKQYFSENTYNSQVKQPDELVRLDIEILSLADSKNLWIEKDVEYVAKFLSNFCLNSQNYNSLSKYGKDKIDSIFKEESPAIKEAIRQSDCSK